MEKIYKLPISHQINLYILLQLLHAKIPFWTIFKISIYIVIPWILKQEKSIWNTFKCVIKSIVFLFSLFSLKHFPPINAGKTSSWVLLCNCTCHFGGHVAPQHEVALMNSDEKRQLQNEKSLHTPTWALWGFQVSSASESWSAVAPNKEGGPPVLPEAIIKIKQNMLCGSKTWQAVEAKHFQQW